MVLPVLHANAQRLEDHLGDPWCDGGPLSFAESVRLDEAEQFNEGAHDLLRAWGLGRLLVPRTEGGELENVEELLALTRVLARRDLAVALAYGSTVLGATPVWLWGSNEQKERVREILTRGGFGAFALTERERGSDIVATDLIAQAADNDRWIVDGTKWCIGNAGRSSFVTLFAKTAPEAGVRGFSLLMLAKDELAPGSFRVLPRIRTLGVRGHDLSGIAFTSCNIPRSCTIGREGYGFDQTLIGTQIVKVLCAGLSLGVADTALRIAARFALDRRLYGRTIDQLANVRAHLATAAAWIAVGECVALVGARAFPMLPEHLGLLAPVTKLIVPHAARRALELSARVLGGRHYLREEIARGMFQKLLRDHAIVSVFEGTEDVNLGLVASQLRKLSRGRKSSFDPERVAPIFDVTTHYAWDWSPKHLRLRATSLDPFVGGWPDTMHKVLAASSRPTELAPVLENLSQVHRTYCQRITEFAASANREGAVAFRLAWVHALLHAAACCAGVWLHRRSGQKEDAWFELALQAIADELARCDQTTNHDDVARLLFDATLRDRFFSVLDNPSVLP